MGGHLSTESTGFARMNIALTDDLQRLLRRKIENGQFPDEEAVVREASEAAFSMRNRFQGLKLRVPRPSFWRGGIRARSSKI